MNKILFISHICQPTGFGTAAKNYLLALDTQFDVIARSVPIQGDVEQTGKLKKLLEKPAEPCDICIQHLLPHYMEYDGNFARNIGLFVTETYNLSYHNWISRLNLMDEIWVPNAHMMAFAQQNGIIPSTKLLPHAFDIKEYEQPYEVLELPTSFKFYTIAEFIKRKNLAALIRAFHNEFTPNEPVELIIKTNSSQIGPFIDSIKTKMKLYRSLDDYKKEQVIIQRLDRKEILRLHKSCDCYVNTSFAEGFCIPAFEAMAFNNFCISSPIGIDYLKNYTRAMILTGRNEPCFRAMETFGDHNTSSELWFSIDILDLMSKMRAVYEKDWPQGNGLKIAKQHSYDEIGKQAKKLLGK